MKKLLLVAAAVVALSTPAMAGGWVFGGAGFVAAGESNSAANNWANAGGWGNKSKSSAGTDSFGQSQSGFGFGIGNLSSSTDDKGRVDNDRPAGEAFGNFVGASVVTGSSSSASSFTSGGNANASTGGSGSADTSFGAAAGAGFGGF